MNRDRNNLTPRQIDVLCQLAQGLTNDEIAAALGIDYRTVQSHIAMIFDKLNVTSRTEATILALDSYIPLAVARAAVRRRNDRRAP